MKALTIWQPWALLLACGAKQYETRGWATSYRGPIAIHAAKKSPLTIMRSLPSEIQKDIFNCIYEHYGIRSGALSMMQTGAVIATAELMGCHQIAEVGWSGSTERRIAWIDGQLNPHYPAEVEVRLGAWTSGRYAWELSNVKMLDVPIPARGKQGLWTWEAA